MPIKLPAKDTEEGAESEEGEALVGTEGRDSAESRQQQQHQQASPTSTVEHLPRDPCSVEAERVENVGASAGELKAIATPPCEFTAHLPESYKPGEPLIVQGPLGMIKMEAPPVAQPGASLRFQLAAKPSHRIRVPANGRPGDEAKFVRKDGVEVTVTVPPGVGPGETFNVSPPALMVKVPEGASPGTTVIFPGPCGPDGEPQEWFRAEVPEGLGKKEYFTACLPMPKPRQEQIDIGRSWVASLLSLASGRNDTRDVTGFKHPQDTIAPE